MLYLVPTPVGNLDDITLRAIETLKMVEVIFCEDTRVTGRLLQHLGIKKTLRSLHAHNEHRLVEQVIDLLKGGQSIAYVSDAGTPGISDPGFLLVREAQIAEIKVSALPGATAFVPALVSSGLSSDKFFFEGFLPQKKGRQKRWDFLKTLPSTIILYESPHRLLKCLKEIQTHFGNDHKVCVAREISKLHEEINTKPVQDLIDDYASRPSIKGEIVLIIEKAI